MTLRIINQTDLTLPFPAKKIAKDQGYSERHNSESYVRLKKATTEKSFNGSFNDLATATDKTCNFMQSDVTGSYHHGMNCICVTLVSKQTRPLSTQHVHIHTHNTNTEPGTHQVRLIHSLMVANFLLTSTAGKTNCNSFMPTCQQFSASQKQEVPVTQCCAHAQIISCFRYKSNGSTCLFLQCCRHCLSTHRRFALILSLSSTLSNQTLIKYL